MASSNQPYEKTAKPLSFRQLALNNFLGGIFWALGVSIGFSVLIALLTLLSSYIDFVPYIGSFVSDILDYVLSYNRNLK